MAATPQADVFQEFALLFPDKFVHIGADEVQSRCWVGPLSGIPKDQVCVIRGGAHGVLCGST